MWSWLLRIIERDPEHVENHSEPLSLGMEKYVPKLSMRIIEKGWVQQVKLQKEEWSMDDMDYKI